MSKLIAQQLRPFRTVGWYCHLFHNTSTEAASPARRRHFSNYKAESEALMMVISLAVDSHQNRTMAVFLTVALSVLQANNKLPHLTTALQDTQQKLQSGPSVDTRPVWSSWK